MDKGDGLHLRPVAFYKPVVGWIGMAFLEGTGKMMTRQMERRGLVMITIAALFLLSLNVALAASLASIGDYVWDDHEISGPDGIKFDVVQLLDLDADGDPDAITTEESEGGDGLGVIWYENPTQSLAQSPAGLYRVGWNLTSVPLRPRDPDPAAVFADLADLGNVLENNLYRFDQAYAIYPSPAFTAWHVL